MPGSPGYSSRATRPSRRSRSRVVSRSACARSTRLPRSTCSKSRARSLRRRRRRRSPCAPPRGRWAGAPRCRSAPRRLPCWARATGSASRLRPTLAPLPTSPSSPWRGRCRCRANGCTQRRARSSGGAARLDSGSAPPRTGTRLAPQATLGRPAVPESRLAFFLRSVFVKPSRRSVLWCPRGVDNYACIGMGFRRSSGPLRHTLDST
mmetsp:Transcript_34526/g.112669  ORF Transcript_34526/g.112669 Transcript_34526/m.112669 type:complete len:207 (+) Transcript_34526:200-820(+)